MLKKFIGSITLTCVLLTSSQIIVPAQRADGLIIAAFTHNHHARHDYCLAGLICLFFIPPLGLILNSETLVDDFDKQLPFLAQTNEGMKLKSELHTIANCVEIKKGKISVKTKQYKKIKGDGKFNSKDDILSKVNIISMNDGKDSPEQAKAQIALSRDFVEQVLNEGDYTNEERELALKTLCQ